MIYLIVIALSIVVVVISVLINNPARTSLPPISTEERIKSVLLSFELARKNGGVKILKEDVVFNKKNKEVTTIGFRKNEYVVESGDINVKLLDGYMGKLTVYNLGEEVDDPERRESFLKTIAARIPVSTLDACQNENGKYVCSSSAQALHAERYVVRTY